MQCQRPKSCCPRSSLCAHCCAQTPPINPVVLLVVLLGVARITHPAFDCMLERDNACRTSVRLRATTTPAIQSYDDTTHRPHSANHSRLQAHTRCTRCTQAASPTHTIAGRPLQQQTPYASDPPLQHLPQQHLYCVVCVLVLLRMRLSIVQWLQRPRASGGITPTTSLTSCNRSHDGPAHPAQRHAPRPGRWERCAAGARWRTASAPTQLLLRRLLSLTH